LFAVGREDGKVSEYSDNIRTLATLLTERPEINDALLNPLYPLDVRVKVLQELIKAMAAPQIVANFLRLLLEKRRADVIPEIAQQLQLLVDAHNNISRGTVTTAMEIDDNLMTKVQATLEKITGKKVILEKKVDPWIIGGLVAKVGDRVLDGSIRSQLMGLKESIKRSE